MKKKKNNEKFKIYKTNLTNNGSIKYKGFLMKECYRYDKFNTVYYTMINTKTQKHVHASSINAAFSIMDLAAYLIKSPYKYKNLRYKYPKSFLVRALKLSM